MQLMQGVKVNTLDGQDMGHIDRVVIDPQTKAITHVVVRKGSLFARDKVIPIDLIDSADKESVLLGQKADDLPEFPDFEEEHFVLANEEWKDSPSWATDAAALLWYPPLEAGPLGQYPNYPEPVAYSQTERNIPPGTIPLKEDAKVISEDGRHVGNIERIVTATWADRATHLIISGGLVLKDRRLIPIDWVTNVSEDEVHLAVGARFLSTLPIYEE